MVDVPLEQAGVIFGVVGKYEGRDSDLVQRSAPALSSSRVATAQEPMDLVGTDTGGGMQREERFGEGRPVVARLAGHEAVAELLGSFDEEQQQIEGGAPLGSKGARERPTAFFS